MIGKRRGCSTLRSLNRAKGRCAGGVVGGLGEFALEEGIQNVGEAGNGKNQAHQSTDHGGSQGVEFAS